MHLASVMGLDSLRGLFCLATWPVAPVGARNWEDLSRQVSLSCIPLCIHPASTFLLFSISFSHLPGAPQTRLGCCVLH